jgi:hypothetical protein
MGGSAVLRSQTLGQVTAQDHRDLAISAHVKVRSVLYAFCVQLRTNGPDRSPTADLGYQVRRGVTMP